MFKVRIPFTNIKVPILPVIALMFSFGSLAYSYTTYSKLRSNASILDKQLAAKLGEVFSRPVCEIQFVDDTDNIISRIDCDQFESKPSPKPFFGTVWHIPIEQIPKKTSRVIIFNNNFASESKL